MNYFNYIFTKNPIYLLGFMGYFASVIHLIGYYKEDETASIVGLGFVSALMSVMVVMSIQAWKKYIQ